MLLVGRKKEKGWREERTNERRKREGKERKEERRN